MIILQRKIWTRTTPGMEAFDDWQPIETAPTDGQFFMGANCDTGNVYQTRYYPRWGSAEEVTEGDVSKAVVWWTIREDGRERSFRPTHWRPMTSKEGLV